MILSYLGVSNQFSYMTLWRAVAGHGQVGHLAHSGPETNMIYRLQKQKLRY